MKTKTKIVRSDDDKIIIDSAVLSVHIVPIHEQQLHITVCLLNSYDENKYFEFSLCYYAMTLYINVEMNTMGNYMNFADCRIAFSKTFE